MSKSRKRVFPKPPERLNSKTAEKLGKNSNKAGYEASLKAIYNVEPKPQESNLTWYQQKMLDNLKKNLSSTYQK